MIERFIVDGMVGAFRASIELVAAADKVCDGSLFPRARGRHIPPTVSAFGKAGKDVVKALCFAAGTALHDPLDHRESLLPHKGFMGVLHNDPILFGILQGEIALKRYLCGFSLDRMSQIGPISQEL